MTTSEAVPYVVPRPSRRVHLGAYSRPGFQWRIVSPARARKMRRKGREVYWSPDFCAYVWWMPLKEGAK